MLAQGTRFRNLNGFFALENKKKQFRQPQKGTRMHKKRYGQNDPVQWRSPDGWSGTMVEPEKRFWHTELSENTEEQKTKLHISVPMHPLFPSPLRALCALRVRNRRIRVELTCRGFLL